jgi:radical SAM superfamily enzyme YgiQ (UPF0313 family)
MPSVILFRPVYDPDSRSIPTYPWALVYLAAVLVERGVDVTIIDEASLPNNGENVKQILQTKRPVAVGITAMTGEQIRYGLEFARLVRKQCKAAIVWGGVHPSLLPEQTVRHRLVDYVVAGEGEYAFADLVECVEKNEDAADIPGVYLVRGPQVIGSRQEIFVDLASLPDLPYHLADPERYICRRPDLGAERYFEICTSRGCPHHCGFCYIDSVHRSCWRGMNADIAVDRIKSLVKRFNLDCVLFREDNFFVERKRVEQIAQRLINDTVGIKWAASCRINYFAAYSGEFIDLLKRSGCVQLTFGVESGSDRVLEFIGKGITVEQALAAAHKVKENGVRGTYHFMGGFPSETTEEFLDTCRLIDKLMEIDPGIVVREMSVFAPYPGVKLIPACVKLGYQEPGNLEAWIEMDWACSKRPWLTEEQSRLIADAQFLIARLAHPNLFVRSWVLSRWRQMLCSKRGLRLRERPIIELMKRHLRS